MNKLYFVCMLMVVGCEGTITKKETSSERTDSFAGTIISGSRVTPPGIDASCEEIKEYLKTVTKDLKSRHCNKEEAKTKSEPVVLIPRLPNMFHEKFYLCLGPLSQEERGLTCSELDKFDTCISTTSCQIEPLEKIYQDAIKQLGSQKFREREAAAAAISNKCSALSSDDPFKLVDFILNLKNALAKENKRQPFADPEVVQSLTNLISDCTNMLVKATPTPTSTNTTNTQPEEAVATQSPNVVPPIYTSSSPQQLGTSTPNMPQYTQTPTSTSTSKLQGTSIPSYTTVPIVTATK